MVTVSSVHVLFASHYWTVNRGGSSLQIWPCHRKLGHTQKGRCPKCLNNLPPAPPIITNPLWTFTDKLYVNTSVYHPIKLKNVLCSNLHSFGAYSTRLKSTMKGKPHGRRDKTDLFRKIFKITTKIVLFKHCIVFLRRFTGSNSYKS